MQFRPGLRLLLIFTPLMFLICFGNYFFYRSELRHTHDQHAGTEYAAVMAGVFSLDRSLQYATRDLLALYEHQDFRKMLNNPAEANMAKVAEDWIAFSRIKRVYHKIRWIDEAGNERIRVNYSDPNPLRVPERELQNRKDRYFFADTFKLGQGEIYVSPLDLNIEHDAIEVPYVPTIRLGIPVYDAQRKKRGILMINYFADSMMQRFEEATKLIAHQVWLVNQDGYWLMGPSPEDEFGFMFQHEKRNMGNRYPEAWKMIHSEDRGQFLTKEGLWSFQTLRPLDAWHKSSTGSGRVFLPSRAPVDINAYQWKIVSLLPMEKYDSGMPYSIQACIGITLLFLLISFGFSFLLVRVQQARNILLHNLEEIVRARMEDLRKLNVNLSQNEARLRSLLESIPDPVWVKDVNGVYLGCNAAFEGCVGMKESDITGKTDFELPYMLDHAGEFRETDAQVLSTEVPQIREFWYTYPLSGKVALFEVIKAVVKTKENEVVGVLGIARDITEHRKAQERLELSALVFRNSRESIQISNAANEIIAVNPAFERMTGYRQEEVLGKNPNILASGRHDQAFYAAMWESLNTHGFWQGELWNRRKNGELYAAWLTINVVHNEDGSVRNYIDLCTDFTREKEAEALIWRQANFDFLTGLPNRSMFMDRLRQEILKMRHLDSKLALLIIDLNGFGEVNDVYGHDAGDTLLVTVARRISETVRDIDVVSRESGDEFGVILTEVDINDVDAVARQLVQVLAMPFKLGDEAAYITVSIGVTIYPDDGMDDKSLLRNAEQAMHAARERGRNRISYFRQTMEEASRRRVALINDLRGAQEAGQFEMMYQPIVDLSSGMIHKAESLVRWRHPVRGIVSPSEFIPLAEETGMIFSISEWIFNEVARQVAIWREHYYPDFQISFNMSPVEFHDDEGDHGGLFDILRKSGAPGNSIVVEITEGLLLVPDEDVIRKLARFHEEGMEVALDDFGTGYSSLSYLKEFDIDYLKIDQSFIGGLEQDSQSMALVEAIIMMGHKLGMKVIAEGVQTEAQASLLTKAGCDYGQGYLFSEPVSATEFEALLGKHNARHV
jgi:diguanylate cyclase (GGDEF)-like protein/PAS domain S-box-containing protein